MAVMTCPSYKASIEAAMEHDQISDFYSEHASHQQSSNSESHEVVKLWLKCHLPNLQSKDIHNYSGHLIDKVLIPQTLLILWKKSILVLWRMAYMYSTKTFGGGQNKGINVQQWYGFTSKSRQMICDGASFKWIGLVGLACTEDSEVFIEVREDYQ